jgi:hypothetical protein
MKEQKTAIELSEMIRSRLPGVAMGVRVFVDAVHGWRADIAMALPKHVVEAQSRVKEIAAELRLRYDLRVETRPEALIRRMKLTRKAG